jgi:hypothetical protein
MHCVVFAAGLAPSAISASRLPVVARSGADAAPAEHSAQHTAAMLRAAQLADAAQAGSMSTLGRGSIVVEVERALDPRGLEGNGQRRYKQDAYLRGHQRLYADQHLRRRRLLVRTFHSSGSDGPGQVRQQRILHHFTPESPVISFIGGGSPARADGRAPEKATCYRCLAQHVRLLPAAIVNSKTRCIQVQLI